jgi:hypothetical protein
MPAARHVATLLCAAALFGCSGESTPNVVAPDVLAPQLNSSGDASGPSANGHANWINAIGEYVSRTFNAREKDGVVDGNFVQHVTSTAGVRRVNKGDIDCLMILPDSRDAVLSGPVHENANPALIGWTQVFRVRDNGEGAGDPEDAQSPLFFFNPTSGTNCRNFIPPVVTPIESGNIQVKP